MTSRTVVSLGVSLLSLALVAGCRITSLLPAERSSPKSVDSPTPLTAVERVHSFYPLELGNRWDYTRTFSTTWVDATGPREFHQTTAIDRELLCETPLGGHSYTAERTLEYGPSTTYISWVYYRQDRFGLYEADDRSSPPCATSPAGIAMGSRAGRLSAGSESGRLPEDAGLRAAAAELEQRLALVRYTLGLPAPSLRRPRPAEGGIVRLAYPLHTDQRWIIRADPRFTSAVEGVDVLRLPAGRFVAYRIRIDSELFGPSDRVRVWYGREGFLQLDAHLVGEGRDENGNPIGTVVSEDHEALDDFALVTGRSD